MKTIELIGQVDEQHQLHASVPSTIPAGSVKILLLLPEAEDEQSDEWMQLIAKAWEAEWSDPREDIYTLEDGEPVDGAR